MVAGALDVLGQPDWHVVVTPKGGGRPWLEFPTGDLTWDRTLNASTAAKVTIPSSPSVRSKCCDLMNGLAHKRGDTTVLPIDVWSHDLNLYADSYLAWSGPLFDMDFTREVITLSARDILTIFERRYCHNHDRILTSDLADNYNVIVQDALEEDDSPNIDVTAKPTGIRNQMTVTAKDWPRAADLMRTLSSAGLDYTAIGRTIYIGGIEILLPDTLPIWDAVAKMAKYQRKGSELSTRYGFSGELRGAERVSVAVGGVDSTYGLLEQHETDLDIKEDETAYAAAQSRLDFLRTPPTYVTASLTKAAPHLKYLIPGTRCDTRLSGQLLGCRDVKEVLRLQSVKGSVKKGETNVDLTLTPLGRVTSSD